MPVRSQPAPKNQSHEPWLNSTEAAEYTGYTVSGMRKMRTENRGPRWSKTPTGHYRYRPSDLDAWMTGETA